MSGLTPGERQGARVLAIVLAVGALTDLWRARHPEPATALAPARAVAAPAPGGTHASGSGSGTGPGTGGSATDLPLVDLDTATAAELDGLPGIGPVLAARIVDYRRVHGRFRRVDELLGVLGIGPRLLERLRPRLSEPGVGSPALSTGVTPARDLARE